MKRGAIIGAFVGAVIPVVVFVAFKFFGYMAGPETVAVWPSSIVLMSLEHSPSFALSVAVWCGSAAVNVGLYALLGLGIAAGYRYVTRRTSNA